MPELSAWIYRRVWTTGGSISRPQNEIFEEAADLAFHFHWSRTEIMAMTEKERTIWLKQINRIHKEQEKKKFSEFNDQIKFLAENQTDIYPQQTF